MCSAVAYWSPLFKEIRYLPQIVFPFCIVFQDDSISCFEAIITFLLNWCQHWFFYYDNPPPTFLQAVDDLIQHYDPALIAHLRMIGADNTHYAWPLLRSMFSEALTQTEWLKFVDFLVCERDRPDLLVHFTAAFIMSFSSTLHKIEYLDDLQFFMSKQNGASIKHLLKRVRYFAGNYTTELPITFEVKRLELGIEYPTFENIPSYI